MRSCYKTKISPNKRVSGTDQTWPLYSRRQQQLHYTPLRFCCLLNLIRQFFHSVIYHNVNPIQCRCVNGGGYVIIVSCWWIGYYIKQTLDDGELGIFIKENTYFASYPYEVFLYLKYQQSTKSCACDKSHWQNIIRVCQRVQERLHASPDMACWCLIWPALLRVELNVYLIIWCSFWIVPLLGPVPTIKKRFKNKQKPPITKYSDHIVCTIYVQRFSPSKGLMEVFSILRQHFLLIIEGGPTNRTIENEHQIIRYIYLKGIYFHWFYFSWISLFFCQYHEN